MHTLAIIMTVCSTCSFVFIEWWLHYLLTLTCFCCQFHSREHCT